VVLLIALLAAVTGTVVVLLVLSSPAADTKKTRDRLRRFVEGQGATAAETALMEEAQRRGRAEKGAGRQLLRVVSRSFDSQTGAKRLQLQLERADVLLKGSEFLVINFLVAAGLGAAGLLMTKSPLLALVGLAVGWMLPRVYLSQRITKRQKAFGNQLAECLNVMSNALKAGYSFLQAMEMVSREMLPPISVEFGRVLREVSLGVTTESALESMTRRVGSDDLDLVITCVLIQRQVGGNLAEILETIAHTIRERIRIHGEIKTLTAQGRMSGLVVSVMPFAMAGVLFLINPKYMGQLFTHPLGRTMLMMGLISEGIGVVLIRKITNVEV
jgi:tight adherence protein B